MHLHSGEQDPQGVEVIEFENRTTSDIIELFSEALVSLTAFVSWYASERSLFGVRTRESAAIEEELVKLRSLCSATRLWSDGEATARANAQYWAEIADSEVLIALSIRIAKAIQEVEAWQPQDALRGGMNESDLRAVVDLRHEALQDLHEALTEVDEDINERMHVISQPLEGTDYRQQIIDGLLARIEELESQLTESQADLDEIQPFITRILSTTEI